MDEELQIFTAGPEAEKEGPQRDIREDLGSDKDESYKSTTTGEVLNANGQAQVGALESPRLQKYVSMGQPCWINLWSRIISQPLWGNERDTRILHTPSGQHCNTNISILRTIVRKAFRVSSSNSSNARCSCVARRRQSGHFCQPGRENIPDALFQRLGAKFQHFFHVDTIIRCCGFLHLAGFYGAHGLGGKDDMAAQLVGFDVQVVSAEDDEVRTPAGELHCLRTRLLPARKAAHGVAYPPLHGNPDRQTHLRHSQQARTRRSPAASVPAHPDSRDDGQHTQSRLPKNQNHLLASFS